VPANIVLGAQWGVFLNIFSDFFAFELAMDYEQPRQREAANVRKKYVKHDANLQFLRKNMRFFKQKKLWKTAGHAPKKLFSDVTQVNIKRVRRYVKLIKLLKVLKRDVRIINYQMLQSRVEDLRKNESLSEDEGELVDTFMLDKSGHLMIVGE